MPDSPEGDMRTIRDTNAMIRALVEQETLEYPRQVRGFIRRNYVSDRGHVYFDLHDGDYSINCFLSNGKRALLDFPLDNNLEVEVFGTIRVYEQQAKVQIDVEQMRLVERSLPTIEESARTALESKGLWPREKRPIPQEIKKIGLVTSKHSEALHDFENMYREENGGAAIKLLDVLVQGQQAPDQIAHAITRLNRDNDVDVIAIMRGGGSARELTIFNDLVIAEAICRSTIPVVTGIGHQRDDTLADQVADYAAMTPTAVASFLARKSVHRTTAPDSPKVNQTLLVSALIVCAIVIVGLMVIVLFTNI